MRTLLGATGAPNHYLTGGHRRAAWRGCPRRWQPDIAPTRECSPSVPKDSRAVPRPWLLLARAGAQHRGSHQACANPTGELSALPAPPFRTRPAGLPDGCFVGERGRVTARLADTTTAIVLHIGTANVSSYSAPMFLLLMPWTPFTLTGTQLTDRLEASPFVAFRSTFAATWPGHRANPNQSLHEQVMRIPRPAPSVTTLFTRLSPQSPRILSSATLFPAARDHCRSCSSTDRQRQPGARGTT